MTTLTLALDMMGGDFGPRITIPALRLALNHYPKLNVILFGDQQQISPTINQFPNHFQQRLHLVHTNRVIADNIPFAQAIRQSKQSSMRLALEAVADGMAQGCVSAGHSGVLMGLSKQLIRPLEQIERPALTSLIPTINGKASVMLDLGANIETDSILLCQFAEMGKLFAQEMLNLAEPRLALLNIGTEEYKGNTTIKQAHQQLKQLTHLNYIGFIEGNKLLDHLADVIVCDGFHGNIALKTLEGMANHLLTLFKTPSTAHHSKFVYWLLKLMFRRAYRTLQKINPERHNGATLLGLSSVVVKSHGNASVNAFFSALQFAVQQITAQVPQKLAQHYQWDNISATHFSGFGD